MRRNDIINRVNQLILYVSRTIPFRSGLDGHLIRGAMVFTFFAFSIQKWSQYTAEMLVPLISHSPVVLWLLPVFGVAGHRPLSSGRPKRSSALSSSLAIGARGLAFWARLRDDRDLHRGKTLHEHYPLPYPMAGPTKLGGFPDHDLLATRFPDEGRPVPRRIILSAQAGFDACGAGDNTELSDLTIQTVRATEL